MTAQPSSAPAADPSAEQPAAPRYDALVLLSFGGPEGQDDVVPFLRNVTRGKNIPDERLEEVGEHYRMFGGRSPINDQNRALLDALRAELSGRGVDLPVLWGNRNWAPYLLDTLREAHEQGARRVLVLTTSAYSSYSGCRQYREDVADALLALAQEGRGLQVDQVRRYAGTAGFVEANADAVRAALDALREPGADADAQQPRLVFVTHSVPTAMDDTAGPQGHAYVAQHEAVAAAVADRVGAPGWDLVYCSRSGPPSQPWLEPDVNDHLEDLAARGSRAVVLAPIGFVSDHMEVVYDLDTEAAATCERLGLRMVRAGTVGTDPSFVRALVDLVVERCGLGPGPALDVPGMVSVHDTCPVGCCRNLRADRPAACGADWAPPVVAGR
jgi:ferrochelatase